MSGKQSYRRLENKVAIVTGSSRGIGLGLARGFAREGAHVILTSRNAASLEEPTGELRRLGVQVLPLQVDVTKREDIQRMAASAEETFGRIDILVNNAGIPLVAPSEELSFEAWQEIVDTNLTGVFLCSQAVARVMLRQGSGSIINIGSLTSYFGFPQRVGYGSTKTAVIGLTRALAVEWAGRGVRVNAIAPGWIRTPLLQGVIDRGVLNLDNLVARTPMGRVGEPEDLVGPAVFLASEDSAFITGQTIVVDGGYLAYGLP